MLLRPSLPEDLSGLVLLRAQVSSLPSASQPTNRTPGAWRETRTGRVEASFQWRACICHVVSRVDVYF